MIYLRRIQIPKAQGPGLGGNVERGQNPGHITWRLPGLQGYNWNAGGEQIRMQHWWYWDLTMFAIYGPLRRMYVAFPQYSK